MMNNCQFFFGISKTDLNAKSPQVFAASPPEFLCKVIRLQEVYFYGLKIKIAVTRCHILRLKCTKIDFFWGSAPDPAGGAYSAPPDWTH